MKRVSRMPVIWNPPTTQKAVRLLFYLGGNAWAGFMGRLEWKKLKTWGLQASACPVCWPQKEVSKGTEMWAATPEPIWNTQAFPQLWPVPHDFLLHVSISWWRGFQELTWQRLGPEPGTLEDANGEKLHQILEAARDKKCSWVSPTSCLPDTPQL